MNMKKPLAPLHVFSVLFALALATAVLHPAAQGQLFRPKKESRTINTDQYELDVQKNGAVRLDNLSGVPIQENVYPTILFEGAEKPKRLKTSQRGTARYQANDRLGQGQGMAFGDKECEWHISTYPGKPFITVKVTYHNSTRKPVRVAALSPWTVGVVAPGRVTMGSGAEQTRLLDNGSLFRNFSDYPKVRTGAAEAQWNLAAYNPVSNRSMIAGFLTNLRAETKVVLERSAEAPKDAFDRMSADCEYNPPVEVPPDGTLESEVFYLAVTEDNPLTGLDRFGKAMAVVNGVRDARPFMPHGWDSWSTKYHTDGLNEKVALENLDFLDKNLKRFGWTHFGLDAGWERGLGDWEANPERFPNGMKAMADEIHRRGMTASLWINPFAVDPNAPLAKEHPEWMLRASPGVGRMLVGDTLILDVTRPEVCDWVRALGAKICREWGYDAIVEADFVYFLLVSTGHAEKGLTNIEVLRRGMQALREGMGPDRFLLTMTPQPVNGVYAEGVRTGRDCAPVWKTDNLEKPWGAVDTLTNTIRRFYMTPHLFVPDQDCVFFGHEATRARWNAADKPALTREQSIAWLTGAALTAGVVKIGDAFTDLTPDQVGLLSKLLPVPPKPAKPLDLFEDAPPSIWELQLDTAAGPWTFLALFNWDTAGEREFAVTPAMLGLPADTYHTVFDFWAETYCGVMDKELRVKVGPGSVRLFGVRPHTAEHPMFVAANHHMLQGALDCESMEWRADSAVTGALSAKFAHDPSRTHDAYILLPESWRFVSATAGTASVLNGRLLTLSGMPPQWEASFQKVQ